MMLQTHLKNIIEKNAKITQEKVLLIYDTNSALSKEIAKAYKEVLKEYHAKSILFKEEKSEQIKQTCKSLKKGDLVILVQSLSFRMSEYRIRMELNSKGILVIEHSHLQFIPKQEHKTYIKSLTYE